MQRIFNLSWLSLILLVIISSCKVEKRHYTKGYYISWNKSKSVKSPGSSEPSANKEDKAIVLNKQKPLLNTNEEISSEINNDIQLEASVPESRITKRSRATRQTIQAQALKLKALNFKPLKFLPDGPEPDDEDAMIALIVSIAGFFVVGLIGSIVGLVLANRALRKIKAQPDKYGGEDLASMARVISIIGIILWIIAIILIIAIISVIASSMVI